MTVELTVFARVDHDVHPVAFSADFACRHEVATKGRILGQIRSEIHLLPFKFFLETVLTGEAELSQMPALNEIDLPIPGPIVNLLRVVFLPQ